MVNQWGRDGTGSSPSSRSSGGGVIVAAVVALLIGGAGGYGGARFLSGASQADIESRDQTITELRQQVATLQTKSNGAATSDTVLRSKMADLQDQVEQLLKANAALKSLNDEQASSSGDDLQKAEKSARDLKSQLDRSRKSLQVSELQIIELEGELKNQQAEIRKLRDDLAKAAAGSDAGNAALGEQMAALQKELAAAKKQAETLPALKKQIAALSDQAAQQSGDAAELERQLKLSKAALAKAEASGDKADQLARDFVRVDAARQALEKDLAVAEDQLAARESQLSDLDARLKEVQSSVDQYKGKASAAEGLRLATAMQVSSLKTEKEKLENENAGLRKTVKDLQAKLATPSPETEPTTPTDQGDGQARDASAVSQALADMPGFSRMTADRQADLQARLVAGECVADALKATLGRVPAIALRNLIRDLGSKC